MPAGVSFGLTAGLAVHLGQFGLSRRDGLLEAVLEGGDGELEGGDLVPGDAGLGLGVGGAGLGSVGPPGGRGQGGLQFGHPGGQTGVEVAGLAVGETGPVGGLAFSVGVVETLTRHQQLTAGS